MKRMLLMAAVVGLLSVWSPIGPGDDPAPPTAPMADTSTPARDAPSIAPPVREPLEPQAQLRIRVVDAEDQRAIAGARIRYPVQHGDRARWISTVTADNGEAVCGPGVIAIAANGYSPQLVRTQGQQPLLSVAVTRAAALRLRFVDGQGLPVAGLATRLLAPVTTGPDWAHDWRTASAPDAYGIDRLATADLALAHRADEPVELSGRQLAAALRCLHAEFTATGTSDADGMIVYAGLPAGAGWRWGCTSPHIVEALPAHESTPLRDDERGLRASSQHHVTDLSGAITLTAGQIATFAVRVRGPATVRGRFPAHGVALRPQVKLYHLTRTAPDAKTQAVDLKQEAFTTANDDGSFAFVGVRPGPKIVRAYWRTSPVDFVFATAEVLLRDGDDHDLGSIAPMSGTIAVRAELRDDAGRELDPAVEFPDAKPAALLSVLTWGARGALPETIHELVSVPVGRNVHLHGVSLGKVRLRALRGADWPESTAQRRVLDAPGLELTPPVPARAVLTLRVERPVARELLLHVAQQLRPELRLWLRPVRGGEPQRLRVPRGEGDAKVALLLTTEPYTVLVTGGDGTPPLAAVAEIDFSAAMPAHLTLAAAGTVRGRCRAATGSALANSKLMWAPQGWPPRGPWTFQAQTDANGAFTLTGLPPGLPLRASRPGLELIAPPAGGLAHVELTAVR
jgi:hypothetical protein